MDIQLHYEEHGNGEPLILLHGNGEDSTYFEHQVAYFQNRFRVIAVDSRGHGKSPRGTAPLTLGQLASDLTSFMDGLAIDSAHILGFSDGANIAMPFATAHPERVKSLVLNGGNLFPEGLTDQTRREIDEEYQAALAADDKAQLELLRLMIDEPHIDPASLAALRMPTLVIAGTDDMIEDDHTRLIAESIPNARLAFVEGTHFVAAENPDAFNRVVEDFLVQA
ncbi:MAG: alpha/beta fold hydrolase [Eggerthellaceae bacterium]|nr:alpha/beta fold hydrolase [Eggerthellaceae bacterium]